VAHILDDHEHQHLLLCNRAFATILLPEQGIAIEANRHSKSDTAVWDAPRDGRARVKRRRSEAGVEKVTGIRQDSYLYRGNDNQILSKRLLDSYSSLTCFGVLRHSLLLDAYGEERRIE
jgi:hypothetical protein